MKIGQKLVKLFLLACVLLVLGCVGASAEMQKGVVTGSVVNMRSGPGTNYEVVGQLSANTVVTVDGYDNGWYVCYYENLSGYMISDYVSLREELVARALSTSTGTRAVELGKRFIGTPYVYGGSSPSGFDCSGFTSYVYRQLGVSLPRTAASQATVGKAVDRANLQPGDLVFFNTYGGISHVGIYVGNNNMIHSPRTGKSVEIVGIGSGYYAQRFVKATRPY